MRMEFEHLAGDKSNAKAVLRNRCKSRAFDRAWTSYTQAFRDYFDSLSRDEKTLIINRDVVKKGTRLENNCMQAWEAREKVTKEKEKVAEVGQHGLILEEAQQRLGGADKLQAAICKRTCGL